MSNTAISQLNAAKPVQISAPLPLTGDVTAPKPYPVECFGSELEHVIRAIEGLTQAPIEICAQSVLSVVALAVQPHINAKGLTASEHPVSIFAITIAATGQRKSAADSLAMRGVQRRQADLIKQFEADGKAYALEIEAYDTTRKGAVKPSNSTEENSAALGDLGDKPEPPLSPFLIASEPTIEALQTQLAEGQPSIGLISDEGGQMLDGYSMSKENRTRTGAALSNLWNGQPINRLRVLAGACSIANKRLGLHLMVQPRIGERFFSDVDLSDQGLHGRVLVVAPPERTERFYVENDPLDVTTVEDFGDKTYGLLTAPPALVDGTRNELNPRTLELSAPAKQRLIAFYNELEAEKKYLPIRGLWSKAAEHSVRIAAVLAYFDNPHIDSIGDEWIARGIALMRFYLDEALRITESAGVTAKMQRAIDLLAWIKERYLPGEEFALVEVYQKGPNAIRTKYKAMDVLRVLQDHNYIVELEENKEIDGQVRQSVWRVLNV